MTEFFNELEANKDENKHTKSLRQLIHYGFKASKHCHELIFADDENIELALAYLSQANTFITNASTICELSSNDELHLILDKFFHQFQTFNEEVMDSARTNHSHQWSHAEFKSLEEQYINLPNAFIL